MVGGRANARLMRTDNSKCSNAPTIHRDGGRRVHLLTATSSQTMQGDGSAPGHGLGQAESTLVDEAFQLKVAHAGGRCGANGGQRDV
jgi:hypothetical protein